MADLEMTLRSRGEPHVLADRIHAVREIVRLIWVSDAFAAQVCYRARARCEARGIPILPVLLHRVSMMLAQVCIGSPVVVRPGLYLAHGQVVIDGFVTVGQRTVIFPWVTIGLRAGVFDGPTIGDGVVIGTGAKLIGPIFIGDGSRVGANAVVVDDVPGGATVVGVPAHVVEREE